MPGNNKNASNQLFSHLIFEMNEDDTMMKIKK